MKYFLTMALALFTLPALADFYEELDSFERHSRRSRVITIIGYGTGGTSHGDKSAACNRAYDRAENDAERQCYRRDGYVLSTYDDSCRCHKKRGSKDDYICDARVELDCEIPRRRRHR